MDTEEYDRKVREYGYGDQPEVDSAQTKQVLATVVALGEHGSEEVGTQSDPQPSHQGSPMSRERPRKDSSSESLLSPEEMVAQAGMDAVYRSDILNKPITPEDVEALEAKRVELLATAKKFKNTAAAMLEERKHAAVFVEDFIQREQEVDEGLAKVKELRKHWEDKIVEAHQEVEKVRRELIVPRKITFATPTEQQPFATPKDNMTKAAEILKKNNEEIDIDYVRTLVASAVKQQSKADTSRKLESNPEHCVSTAQKDARDNRHRDDESRTGSSEREGKPGNTQIRSPYHQRRHRQIRERERMQCTLDETSTATPLLRPMVTRVPLAAVVQPETPGLRGMVELLSATTWSARRNLAGIRTTIVSPSLGGAGMRSATRSPAGAGPRAASATAKAATKSSPDLLSDLEKNSIFCWFDLKTAFEKHFRGTYKRPATASDLQACIQKKGESSRNFLTRWLACRNECENVDHTTAMYAFIGGLQRGGLLRHKLTCLANANKLTLDEMISIASDHTAADDDAGGDIAATAIPLHQQKKNRDNGNNSGHKRKNPDDQKSGGSDMVAMAQRGERPGSRIQAERKGGKGKNKDKEEDSSEAMDEDDNSPDPKAGSAGSTLARVPGVAPHYISPPSTFNVLLDSYWTNIDPNNVPLASLVAQEEHVDVNFIKNNNFNNNAYRNNSSNNYRPYPYNNGNGYGNSYGNSYNNNRNSPPGLEAMLKEFISTQTAFNKSVEEKLGKIDILASKVDSLAADVDLLKSKVLPNENYHNKIVTTANAIQVRINENIRLMAELRARWDREENEKLAKEKNIAKVWTITTTSNANATHVAAPPTHTNKRIGVSNVSTSNAKREKLPETAKTAETACDKAAEIFSNIGDDDPIALDYNGLNFYDCHISEVIKFLQKLAKSPNASAINLAFTHHITNALIKAREEKLEREASIPKKLEDGWEPIIKMKVKDFDCNALCDLGASICYA
ncbi:hypothetical protein QYE76_070738 [Lolium multiflorum]|uniref:Retrotransposon gag domain-containing protein n=1 Tax=Lolium multiflorum TaxID=4521 RepID=A0AAD8SKB8_LOLMU|nr:hypothetical protein QYE76_070738 [Lolium multiflorum]